MQVRGDVQKMKVSLDPSGVVQYQFRHLVGGQEVLTDLRDAIGSHLRLTFEQAIHCTGCGRPTNKSFAQGYCFPCFRSLAACDTCVMSPHTCHFDQGTCREPEWAESHCFVDHYVYLSLTSSVKIGITRHTQIPTRWIDQGAVAAIPLARVQDRKSSGLIEHTAKAIFADRTNWRAIVKGESPEADLQAERERCKEFLLSQPGIQGLDIDWSDEQETRIQYPRAGAPSKVKSHNLEKEPLLEGELIGIQGQYLIFEDACINIRKYTGYTVSLEV